MNKKITFIIICLFFNSCGFQPMLKDYDISNIIISESNYSGKNDLTYQLKNNLNFNEKKESRGFTINFNISENLSSVKKNTSGITTEEDLTINIEFKIMDYKKNNILIDNISETIRLNISNNMSGDDEKRKIAKINIIKNLAQKIKFQIQIISSQTNDIQKFWPKL